MSIPVTPIFKELAMVSKQFIAILSSGEQKTFKKISAAQKWLDSKEIPTGYHYVGNDDHIVIRHRGFDDRPPAYR